MNKKNVLQLLAIMSFTFAQIQTAVKDFTSSNPTVETSALPANQPISPSPIANPPAAKQNKQNLSQAKNNIEKQIKAGKSPALIANDVWPKISIYNNSATNLYIGFENGISLSEIPGISASPENRIQVPAQKNYLLYPTNNPSGKALYLSYQSNEQNSAQTCVTKNGSPSFDTKQIQTFVGTAYISIDPNNQSLLVEGKPN